MPTKASINHRLRETYGLHVECEQALFRVSLAGEETERREGEFWFSESGIAYSVPQKEIRTVKKYEAVFDDNQWVLEILTWIPHTHGEIKSGYTYEPLWAFPAGLPLNWNACQRVCYSYINKVKSDNPKNQKECDLAEQARLAKNKAIIKNRLDNTALASALHDGDAVSLAGLEIPKS